MFVKLNVFTNKWNTHDAWCNRVHF